MAFAHLHIHDEYSALDGFGSPERYVAKAKELGLAGVAITNHGNIDSAIKWQKECKNAELSLAIGCELYITKDLYDRTRGVKARHMNAWVKNDAGWRNLLTLLTIANVDGFYRKPRIDGKAMLEHLECAI